MFDSVGLLVLGCDLAAFHVQGWDCVSRGRVVMFGAGLPEVSLGKGFGFG